MANFGLESRVIEFDGVTEGVSKAGMETYMEYLKVDVIDKIVEALNDTNEVANKINSGWQGQSRDAFLTKFQGNINSTITDIQAEFSNLADRLSELYQSYFEQDEKMIDL